MSAPSISFHCPCTSPSAPPPHLPSSAYAFHELHNLYFCEECDSIRCNRCVSIEVSGYYCPNCLFEMPSASVRAEKHRCSRSCFMCPQCRNTLSVVPSDPANATLSVPPTAAINGQPPFLLYCNFCRWDSAEIGMTFEKPTGLAPQLQKYEEEAIEEVEFDRLKAHVVQFLQAQQPPQLHPLRTGPVFRPSTSRSHVTAAASSALQRSFPGLLRQSQTEKPVEKKPYKEDFAPFKPREAARADHDEEVGWLRTLTDSDEVSSLSQRSTTSWDEPIRTLALKPIRMPLQSKKSKRCPSCRHILIRPEQKAQSVRFKIKLVAANYIPAMDISKPEDAALTSRRRTGTVPVPVTTGDDLSYLQAGRTYHFQMAFTNPLYDSINVRLNLQQPVQRPNAASRRPPFMVSLPTGTITVAAYAEAWEYDDEDLAVDEDIGASRTGVAKEDRGKWKIGVIEKKANTTKIGGEIVLGKEANGDIKFNLMVTYTYKAEDSHAQGDKGDKDKPSKSPAASSELKTFTFWTVVHLGTVAPKADERVVPPS